MIRKKIRGNVYLIPVLVLLLISGVLYAMGTRSNGDEGEYTVYSGLHTLISENSTDYILIDVRTAGEYSSGHIPTAINIPYDIIGSNLPTEDKDSLIILYCRSGNRSGKAEQTLKGLGFTNIHDFQEFSRWEGISIEGDLPGEL